MQEKYSVDESKCLKKQCDIDQISSLFLATSALDGISELMMVTGSEELTNAAVPNIASALMIISESIKEVVD